MSLTISIPVLPLASVPNAIPLVDLDNDLAPVTKHPPLQLMIPVVTVPFNKVFPLSVKPTHVRPLTVTLDELFSKGWYPVRVEVRADQLTYDAKADDNA